jgi:hypothetical protein
MEDKQTGNDWQKMVMDAARESSGFEEAPLDAIVSNLALATILSSSDPECAMNSHIVELVRRGVMVGIAVKEVSLGELVRREFRIEV